MNWIIQIVKAIRLMHCAVLLVICPVASANQLSLESSSVGLKTESLLHDGIERKYHVRLPSGFAPDLLVPAVIVLHGGGGKGVNFDKLMTAGTLFAAADRRNVLLVLPEGIRKQWNDGRPEILRDNRGRDDVGFIAAVLDEVVARYPVDTNRVYATGISNGGHMSLRLATDLSNRIAAVAPVTAQISKALTKKVPERAISVMFINGTKDPLVPFDGGHIKLSRIGRSRGEVLSSAESFRYFQNHNNCGGDVAVELQPDNNREDGTRVEILNVSGCRDGSEVTLVKIINGGHTWPGGNQYLRARRVGPVSRDINASEMILDFLLTHSL